MNAIPIILQQTGVGMAAQGRAGQRIKIEVGSRPELLATRAVASPQVQRQRFARARLRLQRLGLKHRRFAGERAANVLLRIAHIQRARAAVESRGPDAEAEECVVGPVDLVVPAAFAWPGEARNLVLL